MVCLTGFMGSGKSTVGRLLAAQLAWRFVDLDDEIESHTGLPISQIFEQKGEAVGRGIMQQDHFFKKSDSDQSYKHKRTPALEPCKKELQGCNVR